VSQIATPNARSVPDGIPEMVVANPVTSAKTVHAPIAATLSRRHPLIAFLASSILNPVPRHGVPRLTVEEFVQIPSFVWHARLGAYDEFVVAVLAP